MRVAALCLAASQLALAPATAATLVPSAGKVSVDAGTGFRIATGPVVVRAGDRVMVGPGGMAVIAYGEGCSAPVAPGAVVAVSPGIPCHRRDVTTTSAIVEPLNPSVLGPIVTGGAVVGGIAAAAAIAVSQSGSSPVIRPLSP